MSAQHSPEILVRSSSKQKREKVEKKKLLARESQQELKRRASNLSTENVEYKKLKMEIVEYMVIEQEQLKAELDLDNEAELVDPDVYARGIRETNERLIALHEECWGLRQQIRSEGEKAGTVTQPTLDLEALYIETMVHIWKDPTKRSRTGQSALVKDYKDKYQPQIGRPEPEFLWCPITKQYFHKSIMSAAHIIPARVDPSIINYICPGGGARLFTADNTLYINTLLIHTALSLFLSIPKKFPSHDTRLFKQATMLKRVRWESNSLKN